MEKTISKEFRSSFEKLVIPIFEKYLKQLFSKTSLMFQRGFKYYSDKITLEEKKFSQYKDQLA